MTPSASCLNLAACPRPARSLLPCDAVRRVASRRRPQLRHVSLRRPRQTARRVEAARHRGGVADARQWHARGQRVRSTYCGPGASDTALASSVPPSDEWCGSGALRREGPRPALTPRFRLWARKDSGCGAKCSRGGGQRWSDGAQMRTRSVGGRTAAVNPGPRERSGRTPGPAVPAGRTLRQVRDKLRGALRAEATGRPMS